MAWINNIIGAYDLLTVEEANLVDEFVRNSHDYQNERNRLANLVLRSRALSAPPATRGFLKEWVRVA